MKHLKPTNTKFYVFIFALLPFCFYAQKSNNVIKDEKIDQLLVEKRKANAGITVNDNYKIQIFNGTLEESKKSLQNFKQDFKQIDGTITYNDPNYKVWVGSYRFKIEAEKSIIAIKKKYPNALIIEPNKK